MTLMEDQRLTIAEAIRELHELEEKILWRSFRFEAWARRIEARRWREAEPGDLIGLVDPIDIPACGAANLI